MLTYIRYTNLTKLRSILSSEVNHPRRDIPNISMVYEAWGLSNNQIWEEKEKTAIIFHKLPTHFRTIIKQQNQNTKSHLWDLKKDNTACGTTLLLKNLIKLLVRNIYWPETYVIYLHTNANIYPVCQFHQAKMHLKFCSKSYKKK